MAFRCGIPLSEYEVMTPHELRLAVDAHHDRMQNEREQAIVQAYYTAVWARWVRRPPKLKHVLEKLRGKKDVQKMTPEQWLEMLKKQYKEGGK